jgi:2-phosphoglycolate phosphatase
MSGLGAPLAGVIFDLDGTLVDSVPMSLSITNAMLAERGSPLRMAYAEALPFASFGGAALVRGLLGADCGDLDADLATFRQRYAATRTPAESIYPGVAEMLAGLGAAGLRLAICSNKPQHLCEKVLGELGIAHHFAAIVGSSERLPPKPEPDMLAEAVRQIGLAAETCVMVGDSEVDIALARSLGMECLFVEYGYGNADADVPAAHRFADCSALARALLARLAAAATPRPAAAADRGGGTIGARGAGFDGDGCYQACNFGRASGPGKATTADFEMNLSDFVKFTISLALAGALGLALAGGPAAAQVREESPEGQSNSPPAERSTGIGPTEIKDAGANPSIIVQSGKEEAGEDSLLDRSRRMLKKAEPSEFEKYVERVLGRSLPVFGADLILPENRDFAVPATATVPPDYRLNVGDTIDISLSGSVDGSVERTIDTNGEIFLPGVGMIKLVGVRTGDLKAFMMRAIGTQYRNFRVGVRVEELRGIRVYVTGFANNPGAYTVSSLSSLANAVLQAGGPSAGGSMRSVKLIRDGREFGTFDLYELLLGGSRLNDFVLENEDVLLVPPVGRQVAVFGSVNNEAIFELRAGETLADMVALAGGVSSLGDPARLLLYRAVPEGEPGPREIAMGEAARVPAVEGDIVQIFELGSLRQPVAGQSIIVRIEGEVARPGNYYVPPQTPLSEVIAQAGGLTSRAFPYGTQLVRNSVRVQQRESFNYAIDQVELTLAASPVTIDNSVSPDQQQRQMTAARSFLANLRDTEPDGRLVLDISPRDTMPPGNLVLENNDRIYIPPRPSSIGVFGAVYRPGSFMIDAKPRRIREYIDLSGGTIDAADKGDIFVVRANGAVLTKDRGALSAPALPGDVVFVPVKTRETDILAKIAQISTVLFQLGLAAATVLAVN